MALLYTTGNGCRIKDTAMEYKITVFTVNIIKENSDSLKDMVTDILRFSAPNIMDSGRMTIKLESILKSRKATYTQRYLSLLN